MVGGVGQSTPAMNLFTGIAILVLCTAHPAMTLHRLHAHANCLTDEDVAQLFLLGAVILHGGNAEGVGALGGQIQTEVVVQLTLGNHNSDSSGHTTHIFSQDLGNILWAFLLKVSELSVTRTASSVSY